MKARSIRGPDPRHGAVKSGQPRCRPLQESRWTLWRFLKNNLPPVSRRRSEEHTSELQSLMRISYAVFCLKKKKTTPFPSPQQPYHSIIPPKHTEPIPPQPTHYFTSA